MILARVAWPEEHNSAPVQARDSVQQDDAHLEVVAVIRAHPLARHRRHTDQRRFQAIQMPMKRAKITREDLPPPLLVLVASARRSNRRHVFGGRVFRGYALGTASFPAICRLG